MKREDFYKLFLEQLPKDLPYLSIVQEVKKYDCFDIYRKGKHLLRADLNLNETVFVTHYDIWTFDKCRNSVFDMLVYGDDIRFDYPDHALTVLREGRVLVNLVI